jgi:hypothetical protein
MQNALCGLIKNRPAAAVRRRNAKSCKLTPPAAQAALIPVVCERILEFMKTWFALRQKADAFLIGLVSWKSNAFLFTSRCFLEIGSEGNLSGHFAKWLGLLLTNT